MHVLKTLSLACAVLSASPTGDVQQKSTADVPTPSVSAVADPLNAPDALFQEVLRLEASGDFDARDRALRKTLEMQPHYAPIHWQLGKVKFRGRWLSPEEISAVVAADPILAKYRETRLGFTDSATDHFNLARWCRRKDLESERQAHLLAAVELDPTNPRYQRSVGRSQHQGRWMSDEELLELKRLDEQAVKAYRTWKPTLHKLRRQLDTGDSQETDAAQETLLALRDPLAITALEEVFSTHSQEMGLLAVKTLGRMPHQESTFSLVRHAVWSDWPSVREAAVGQLQYRDSLHYMPTLIECLRPTHSSETWVRLGNGTPVSVWFWQDFDTNYIDAVDLEFLNRIDVLASPHPTGLSRRIEGAFGLKGETSLARTRRRVVRRGLVNAEKENRHRITNTQTALAQLTNQQLGEDQQAWQTWWAEANHLYYDPSSSTEPERTTFSRSTDNYDP